MTTGNVSEFLGKSEELIVMGKEQRLQEKEEKEEKVPQIRLHSKMLGGKKNTPLRTDYGINYYLDHAGEDKPPVISYREDKYIIINLDNELVKNCIALTPSQRLVALAQLIARRIFHVLESSNDARQYEGFLDNFVTKQYSKILIED